MEEDVKPIYGAMAVATGFVVSLGMFAGGAGTAAYFIAIEPDHRPGPSVDVTDLWTATPRSVKGGVKDLERLPAREGSALATPAAAAPVDTTPAPEQVAETPQDDVDGTTTASLAARPEQPPVDLVSQHVAWCFDRYRSYRVEDDSYTPYAGGRRACVSPWSGDLAAWAETPASDNANTGDTIEIGYQNAVDDGSLGDPIVRSAESGELFYAAADTGFGLSDDHIDYCFSRYRSYRPEDNSYQPYGGGPRRQCR